MWRQSWRVWRWDLEFGQQDASDFKEFEDFSRRRSGRFRRIRRLPIMKDLKPSEGQEAWQFHLNSFNPDWSSCCWNLWNSWVMGFYNQVEEATHAEWFCVRPWRSSCCSMVSQGEYRTSGILCIMWQLSESEGYCEQRLVVVTHSYHVVNLN
jgi:hypothetical protein